MTRPAGIRAGRNRARRCAVQSLYQALLTGQTLTEIAQQFRNLEYLDGADEPFYDELLQTVARRRAELEQMIGRFADRAVEQIDPVELAVLYVALAELDSRIDIPYRVVLDEAIGLARRYGSADSHRYVNAIVDRAASELRSAEYGRR